MHPAIATGPLLGLLLGIGTGAVLSSLVTRPTPSRVVRSLGFILFLGSWLAYASGVINWRINVAPALDGSEGSGAGFGDIFVHLIAIIPTLFLTGAFAAIVWNQTKRSKA